MNNIITNPTQKEFNEALDIVKDYLRANEFVFLTFDAEKNTIESAIGVNKSFENKKEIFGDTRRSSRDRDDRDRYSNGATYVSYRSYSDRDRDDRERRRESRYAYDYKELIFDNRSDAKEVLDTLLDILDTYDSVSVGDLYDAVGMSHNYTDNDYGWTNLSSAEVVCIRGDYMLRLPKAKPLR